MSLAFSSCKTVDEPPIEKSQESQKGFEEIEKSIAQLKDQVAALQEQASANQKNVISLQNEFQSQNEEIMTQKKNISILNRGLRSGIFEELPEDIPKAKLKESKTTMLPDFVNGRSGFSEEKSELNRLEKDISNKKDSNIGPKDLLAHAEIKIRKSELKEGLIELDELKKNFPNFEDNGRAFLLAADAHIKLKEYDNALPEIRKFYLKYPTSVDIIYAKLLEAQCFEGKGSFERSANLYNEVISLSPQSRYAQLSKDGMLRMRDQK